MKKEFTTWDVFVIGFDMFVLGMTLFRITDISSGHTSAVVALASFNILLSRISSWFAVLWMVTVVGLSIYTYMKNRKNGLTVWRSIRRYTWAYLLLEIPLVFAYQLAINVRM